MPQIDWMHVIALASGAVGAYLMQRLGIPKPADAAPFPPIVDPARAAKAADPPTFRVILVKEESAK